MASAARSLWLLTLWQMPCGASVNEALSMVQRFQSMMKGEDEFPKATETERYGGVAQFPVRIKCANLTWHTLKAAGITQ